MERFMTTSGLKRRVLIVDDEIINRELLGAILSQNYDTAFAANGEEAMELLSDPEAYYSLILLDLMMPVMDGFEVIERCRADERLRRIPIIVMTSEKSAEVRSIRTGAADFITKPYDMPEVILARCERTIELSEDESIIRSTERDKISGLYTRDYFFAYLQRLIPRLDVPMDAVALNIDRFQLINEILGRQEGDRILKCAGDLISDMLTSSIGIACRGENDTFFVFIERRDDYPELTKQMQKKLDSMAGGRHLHLKAGVYSCEPGEGDPEIWFSRAKAACEGIRGSFGTYCARYSNELYERMVFYERLISDVNDAIENRDFVVYYQPKYNIQGERPKLVSAEALIRWNHPELGFISPGEFISLFEKNGLIRKIDYYVWREAATQIKRWRKLYGTEIPVSVNVSRVDIFDTGLESKLSDILDEFSLDPSLLMLEITETAYSGSADRLIEAVDNLREKGFRIEMDDFGTGYSSLNMLTSIPIDILKLDMQFIRRMLMDQKAYRLVEMMIDIAGFLDAAVVAEGVEEEEQLKALKKMGCDIVQGFYFSPPLPAERFGELIEKELKEREGSYADN